MLIDRLQSLIAVLITLIGVLLAYSAPEAHPARADWSNETHRQSDNKSLNKNSQDWLGGKNMTLAEEVADHRWLSSRKSQEYLASIPGGEEYCCPSHMEMIEPRGGSNPDGLFVELYSDGADRQRFYEVSCKPGVEGKPCLFMERKLHGHSVCVQQYSYSYAIVREEHARHRHHLGGGGGGKQFLSLFPSADNNMWKLDYIKVRSGCACQLHQSAKEKQQKQRRKNGGGKKSRR